MSPTEYDAMLQGVSNHISRSELLRRLSTHSSSTSGSSKRGPTRITKPTSASSSPHYVQRRRTTANHTSRTYPRTSQDNPYHTGEQRLRNSYISRNPAQDPRPMSWHPASDTLHTPGGSVPMQEPALVHTIAGLESLAVSGNQAPSVQQSIHNAFTMGYGYPVSAPSVMYEDSPLAIPGHGTLGPCPEASYNSYPVYSVSDQVPYPYTSNPPTYDAYSATNYQLQQQWPQYSSQYHMTSQVPQTMPDYAPSQVPNNLVCKDKASGTPQLHRKKSKELVGMGLYDDRETDFMSTLNQGISDDPSRGSLGKGLKLEETWQPPKDDDDEDEEEEGEDEDEGYSTDEAEEVEEDPLPIMASAPAKPQTAAYPAYADLSNQSFFFNDDDDYTNEDHYANYLTYGQGLQINQPKPPMNTGMENYLWL